MRYTKIDVVVDDESKEIWKPCPSYPGYEASNFGRVRSVTERSVKLPIPVSRLGKEPPPPVRTIITQRLNPGGFAVVTLFPSKHPTIRMVHVLVLDAFVGPRPHNAMIQHLDGDKVNNALSNLRYVSNLSVNGQPGGAATASAQYIPPEAVWTVSERGAVRCYAETLEELLVRAEEYRISPIPPPNPEDYRVSLIPPPDPEDEIDFNFDQ